MEAHYALLPQAADMVSYDNLGRSSKAHVISSDNQRALQLIIYFQLFMQFDGPATILVQSRGPRLNDVLSGREVNEIADTPRGITSSPSQSKDEQGKEAGDAIQDPEISRLYEDIVQEVKGISQSVAKIRKDGKVEVEVVGKTKEL